MTWYKLSDLKKTRKNPSPSSKGKGLNHTQSASEVMSSTRTRVTVDRILLQSPRHVFSAPPEALMEFLDWRTRNAKLNSAKHQSGQPAGICLSTAVSGTVQWRDRERALTPPTQTHRSPLTMSHALVSVLKVCKNPFPCSSGSVMFHLRGQQLWPIPHF